MTSYARIPSVSEQQENAFQLNARSSSCKSNLKRTRFKQGRAIGCQQNEDSRTSGPRLGTLFFFFFCFLCLFFSCFKPKFYFLAICISCISLQYFRISEENEMWWSLFLRIITNIRVTFQSRQSNIEAANFFSSSTPISAIEVHK